MNVSVIYYSATVRHADPLGERLRAAQALHRDPGGPRDERRATGQGVQRIRRQRASPHGGQESTLLALCNTVHHIGGIVVAPGYTEPSKYIDGNPYGTSHVTAEGKNPVDDIARTAARVQAKRLIAVTGALRDGLARG